MVSNIKVLSSEIFFGLKKGTLAPYSIDFFLISLLSVKTIVSLINLDFNDCLIE